MPESIIVSLGIFLAEARRQDPDEVVGAWDRRVHQQRPGALEVIQLRQVF
jgi:hypothetical protein